ncbi:hypothetical protein [Streptomyces antarcticus]|uniref:hypothetical protein n=1 Tax=Streptomyces antarcticus TaxID=2996458 RepID=UPI00226F0BB7|nr:MULTISPECIES: hypothetical protein [unclassified Streptomyces]MCY0942434.1 hypothetical protein [Streptomyces sp. H34-AA3]MCZ4080569.1 hypothetical protein [Streptomyces sp. H34-S5]
MVVNVSAVVLLAILVALLVKKGGLKAGHAIVCTLLGFYLASSSVAPAVSELAANVARLISGIKV